MIVDYQKLFLSADNLRNNAEVNKAIAAYREIAQIAEKEKNLPKLGQALHMAGVSAKISAVDAGGAYYRDANAYYQAAVQVFTQIGDNVSLGAVYRDMGILEDFVGNYQTAPNYFAKSLELLSQTDDLADWGISLVKFGQHYLYTGDYETSEKYILEGIRKLKSEPTAGFYYASSLLTFSMLNAKQGKDEQALDNAAQSLSWFEAEHDGEQHNRRLAQLHGLLAVVYARVGDSKQAQSHSVKYQEFIKRFDTQAIKAVEKYLSILS